MTKKDGGPVHPQPDWSAYGIGPNTDNDGNYLIGGMSLRDWFAGQALTARLSSFESLASMKKFAEENDSTLADEAAIQAYAFADAMLEARSK